ncbi:MAG: ABC transporter permease [Gammaproteobacteria bacterium]|nr:ABC transporter permease [Gammaproteobacteria bacterium]MDE0444579.1 ABC transporter permease [Gammaproteobacteria bacterium]
MRVLNRRPGNVGAVASAAMPFVLALVVYVVASGARLAENPDDKLLPSLVTIGDAIERLAFTPDRRTGDYVLWTDTAASLKRLLIGVGIAAVVGLAVGVPNGLLPWFGGFWSPWVRAMSMIPPLAILPILFIVFGIGELAKVMLIVLGTAPFLMRDIEQRVRELPREQLVKAQTLDGTTWQIAVRVVLPQVLPRLVDGVRLSLGGAWLFLIAAEAIASTDGLGYRIFLVRRYLSMDVILPYVAWITLLAFLLDYALRRLNRRCFPWYGA